MRKYQPKTPKLRTLSSKKIAVVTALLTGATNDEAARMAGVSGATVERYKADPAFRESMANLASETLLLVSERLIALSLRAMDALEEIITVTDDQIRTADRLKAIELVFNNLEKARTLSTSLSDRVGLGLEEVVEVTSKNDPPSKVEYLPNGHSRETMVFFNENTD